MKLQVMWEEIAFALNKQSIVAFLTVLYASRDVNPV
jgi:hypothetical protein